MEKKGWGRIVNISSVWGKISKTGRAAYSASKFALDGLTVALSAEYSSRGIMANCVAPGFIDTSLTRQMLTLDEITDLVSTVPLQKNNPQNTSETKGAFAYVCRWNSMESARFLQKLLASNVNVRYAEKSFKIEGRIYEPGTLVIIKGENSDQDIDSIIVKAAKNLFIDIKTCSSGYVEKGNDFGSSSYKEIKAPSIGMIAGEGLSPLNTGEIWYFFEQVMSTPFMMFRPDDLLNNQNLENIDILFLPEGQLSSELISVIDDWVQHGGRLIVFGDAAKNFLEVFGIGVKEQGAEFGLLSEREELSLMITGAIYDCDIERKHPLSFGYTNYHTLRQNASHYFLNFKSLLLCFSL